MRLCIGISFYNAGEFLDYAICSGLNQTYKNWKLLLLNDGSTDNSLDIAMKYQGDPRIEVLSDGENRGLIYRLNQLISLCESKYFVRMDADDIMHPLRLERQVSFMENNAHIDVLGSWAYSIDVTNKVCGILKVNSNPDSLMDVFSHSCFIHPSIMGKTSWFQEHQYDSSFVRMEDMELWARTILNSSFHNLQEPLLYYREIGVPYLRKYLQSMTGERILIRKIYGDAVSFIKYEKMMKTYIKSLIYIFFSLINGQKYLIGKRSCRVISFDYQCAMKELRDAIRR